jgi:hypothetical protein
MPVPPSVDLADSFIDLICADQDLLRAEFDEIVRSLATPPRRPRHGSPLASPVDEPARWRGFARPRSTRRQQRPALDTRGGARPRSPPAPADHKARRKEVTPGT